MALRCIFAAVATAAVQNKMGGSRNTDGHHHGPQIVAGYTVGEIVIKYILVRTASLGDCLKIWLGSIKAPTVHNTANDFSWKWSAYVTAPQTRHSPLTFLQMQTLDCKHSASLSYIQFSQHTTASISGKAMCLQLGAIQWSGTNKPNCFQT